MRAQKTAPDKLEEDICNELHKLDNTPRGKGNTWWTEEVKNAVGDVLKERNYKVYASNYNQTDGSERLYDLTGIEEEDGYLKSIPLVLESEWKNAKGKYESRIRYDFEKLLVSRAEHRVMVLEAKSEEKGKEVVERLLQHVKKCRHSTEGDRYLFACCRQVEKKWGFDCSVYVVKG